MPQQSPLDLLRAAEYVRVFDKDVSNSALADVNWWLGALQLDGLADRHDNLI